MRKFNFPRWYSGFSNADNVAFIVVFMIVAVAVLFTLASLMSKAPSVFFWGVIAITVWAIYKMIKSIYLHMRNYEN